MTKISPRLWGRGKLGGILRDDFGEGNCESIVVARPSGEYFCRETFQCLAGPSEVKMAIIPLLAQPNVKGILGARVIPVRWAWRVLVAKCSLLVVPRRDHRERERERERELTLPAVGPKHEQYWHLEFSESPPMVCPSHKRVHLHIAVPG